MSESSIIVDPTILGGKPVVRGTRIPVELLLRKLSEGASVDDLLEAYPRLTEADVHAAIAHAVDAAVPHRRVL